MPYAICYIRSTIYFILHLQECSCTGRIKFMFIVCLSFVLLCVCSFIICKCLLVYHLFTWSPPMQGPSLIYNCNDRAPRHSKHTSNRLHVHSVLMIVIKRYSNLTSDVCVRCYLVLQQFIGDAGLFRS